MIPYVLHVALLISICLLFYKIFLQRETFYRLNRVILLVCMGLSFVIPIISIPQAWTLRSTPEQVVVNKPAAQQIDYTKVKLPVVQPVQKHKVNPPRHGAILCRRLSNGCSIYTGSG
jgi:hypothetical protein